MVLKIYSLMYGGETSIMVLSEVGVKRLLLELQLTMWVILVIFEILLKDEWYIFRLQKRGSQTFQKCKVNLFGTIDF